MAAMERVPSLLNKSHTNELILNNLSPETFSFSFSTVKTLLTITQRGSLKWILYIPPAKVCI